MKRSCCGLHLRLIEVGQSPRDLIGELAHASGHRLVRVGLVATKGGQEDFGLDAGVRNPCAGREAPDEPVAGCESHALDGRRSRAARLRVAAPVVVKVPGNAHDLRSNSSAGSRQTYMSGSGLGSFTTSERWGLRAAILSRSMAHSSAVVLGERRALIIVFLPVLRLRLRSQGQ